MLDGGGVDSKNTVTMEQRRFCCVTLEMEQHHANAFFFWFPTIVMSEMCSMAWGEMLFVKQDALMPLHRATDALSNDTATPLDGARHN
jgi:hypothetical protein